MFVVWCTPKAGARPRTTSLGFVPTGASPISSMQMSPLTSAAGAGAAAGAIGVAAASISAVLSDQDGKMPDLR